MNRIFENFIYIMLRNMQVIKIENKIIGVVKSIRITYRIRQNGFIDNYNFSCGINLFGKLLGEKKSSSYKCRCKEAHHDESFVLHSRDIFSPNDDPGFSHSC